MKYVIFGQDGSYDSSKVSYEDTNDTTRDVMKKLLARRGLLSSESIENFLTPKYEDLVKDPFGIKGVKEGAERIVSALESGEKLCIYSDYDCDGIPGGTILSDFFDHIGYTKRVHYIPHRHKEGYGLNKGAIDVLYEQGVTLIITVDNGITNVEEVAYAEKKKVNVIVTDHHLPIRKEDSTQLLPPAFTVINSKQDDCTYYDDMLCGAAVAWKLVTAVLALLREEVKKEEERSRAPQAREKKSRANQNLDTFSPEYKAILQNVKATKEGWEKWWLDLVAISTVADMVPLQKENRALAYFGLKVLQKSPRPGLQKLFSLTKTKQDKLNAMDIAFTIAPRINAASRMSDPIIGYQMLKNGDAALSVAAASELEKLNTLRKDTVKGIKKEVMGYDLDAHTHVVVIGNESWGPGVLGLIAQEVFDETGKPTFVFGAGEMEGEYKGSCRAPEHVNLVELMSACISGTFLGFGGHASAGGFSVARDKVQDLVMSLNTAYEMLELSHAVPEEEVTLDAILSFDEVSNALFRELSKLEPCGEGNPRPLFAFTSAGASSLREFGKTGGHYELLYSKSIGGTVKAIYFFGEEKKLEIAKSAHTLIAEMEVSYFGFKPELRLRVVDIVVSI